MSGGSSFAIREQQGLGLRGEFNPSDGLLDLHLVARVSG